MSKVQLMKLSYDFHEMDFDIDFPLINTDEFLEEVYETIGCDTIDTLLIDDDFSAIVDDNGLLISENPVFEFNEGSFHLAGVILIAKNVTAGDEIDFGEITINDAYKFLEKYNIKIVGKTS